MQQSAPDIGEGKKMHLSSQQAADLALAQWQAQRDKPPAERKVDLPEPTNEWREYQYRNEWSEYGY